MLKKILLMVILAMSVVGCSLLDNEAYQEMKQETLTELIQEELMAHIQKKLLML